MERGHLYAFRHQSTFRNFKSFLNTRDKKLAKFQGRNFTRLKDITENPYRTRLLSIVIARECKFCNKHECDVNVTWNNNININVYIVKTSNEG